MAGGAKEVGGPKVVQWSMLSLLAPGSRISTEPAASSQPPGVRSNDNN